MYDRKKQHAEQPQSRQAAPIPLVGIGASAGGLEPLQVFFEHCPSDSGLAFIVLMHLAPQGESLLTEILMKSTGMSVEPIVDGMAVEPDRVYVLQPGCTLTIRDGFLETRKLVEKHPSLVINEFFESLAQQAGDHSIGIVLSGTGTDGTEGVKAIHEAGGLVIAQEPDESQFDGMPSAAVHTGIPDLVLNVADMPEHLIRYVQHAVQFSGPAGHGSEGRPSTTMQQIIELLSRSRPNDFTRYKEKTLIRRVYRRMGLCHQPDEESYLALLQRSEEEVDRLYQDLLISVTAFFRDPPAMRALDEQVLATLVEDADTDRPIRVWVPGCATGEEAYSIAIMLQERLEASPKKLEIQIFATDIDERALDIARQGIYPDSIASHVPKRLLGRYFSRSDDYYRINKEIREKIVFAFQNLVTGAPFSQLDLITCRNLLIYLKLDLQNQMMGLFHFALRDKGYLFLGSSETIGRKDNLFRPIDRRNRIYQRQPGSRRGLELPFAAGRSPQGSSTKRQPHAGQISQPTPRASLGERVQRHLLNHYTPASVLVSKDGEVLYFVGETSSYLKHPTGEPSRRLFDLARGSIKSRLRTLFRQAVDTGVSVQSETLPPAQGGQDASLVITVSPLPFSETTHYLIVFEEFRGPGAKQSAQSQLASSPDASEQEPALVRQLEDELQATRVELHCVIDELETSNQELKVSHEEAISMNEELQSTNEELETSKEELQSLNEEMSTVNSELQIKVDQLDQAYSDLDNLLKSISSATIFIDREFRIRLFTPNCRALFNLVATDIGRPLDEVKFKVEDEHLLKDASTALESLQCLESEVRAGEAEWHLRRISPYRTGDNKIDGVVITYTDITRLKTAQNELCNLTRTLENRVHERTEELQEHIRQREQACKERDLFFELSSVPFFVISPDGYFRRLNPAWTRAFGWTEEELHERPYLDFIHPQDLDGFKAALQKPRGISGSVGVSARFRARDGSYSWLEWEIERTDDDLLLGVVRDVSERMQSAHAVQRAQEELEKQVNRRTKQLRAEKELAHVTLMSIGEAVITTDVEGRITSINPVAERLTGWNASDSLGTPIAEVLELRNEDTSEPLADPVALALQKSRTVAVSEPALLIRQDGESVNVDASVSPVYNNQGELLGAVAVFFDVSYARELTKRIRHRASHDDLTGLVNRGEFERRLKTVVTSARQEKKEHALLFMDLDRFKIINDTCGHLAGDELLKQISAQLQVHIRQRDTIARLGGDEFGLILENCNAEQAYRIANDMLTFMRNFRFSWEEETFQLGMSVGIALINERVSSVRQVIHNADSACYMAKEAGRDRIYVFDEEHEDDQQQNTYMYWVTKINQALEQDNIELMAQPIVALATGQEKGSHFEILARLRDEEGEMISPARFIHAAERYNLMPRLDRHIVNKVFKWLADNPEVIGALDICSINLSASTLGDDRFPEFLKTLAARHKIPTSKVCFEITETVAIRNLEKTIELAEKFKDLGFLFSLDDFGSGFASYHYLKRLPVDFLKIDGEFVRGILSDPMDEAMVRSMNEIGHIMGKKTIAEFVESENLLDKLRDIGVDYVQGFNIGKPGLLQTFSGSRKGSSKA